MDLFIVVAEVVEAKIRCQVVDVVEFSNLE